jgi:hypothetical protein
MTQEKKRIELIHLLMDHQKQNKPEERAFSGRILENLVLHDVVILYFPFKNLITQIV